MTIEAIRKKLEAMERYINKYFLLTFANDYLANNDVANMLPRRWYARANEIKSKITKRKAINKYDKNELIRLILWQVICGLQAKQLGIIELRNEYEEWFMDWRTHILSIVDHKNI